MKQFGIKGKINLGFSMLFLLLMISGAISIFELTRMRNSISGVLSSNVQNLMLLRQVSDVAHHIDYSMQELVKGSDNAAKQQLMLADSLAAELRTKAATILGEQERSDADRSIEVLLNSLHGDLSRAFGMSVDERRHLYFNQFLPASRQLVAQADDLMQHNQDALRENAKQIEQSRYRAIVPGIISVFAGLLLILLFNYFINYFFVNPLIKIARAVENTVEYGSPFRLNIDSNDEIGELTEAISQLAVQAKKANDKSLNDKKA